jgi:ArsR family transcriptional regulator, arsenate/arsenite/antimonite-responsive transcriptional repressor
MDVSTTTAALHFAPKFAALGHEARLAVVRCLLSTHPDGMVVGEIQQKLDIPPSTLSHHLDALQREGLVRIEREGKYLRYRADAEGLRELLAFLYVECCTRSQLVPVNPAAWPRVRQSVS